MNITQHEQDGVVVFELQGRIDSAGAAEMDQALQAAVAEGKHRMILNMSQATYINSAGLRTLADILTQNRNNDGNLYLVAVNPKVERVLKIIGFDRFFQLHPTLEAALSAY